MTARKRYWRVEGLMKGWAVTRLQKRRATATSPNGYIETVFAPGSPFRSREEAARVAAGLNGPRPHS